MSSDKHCCVPGCKESGGSHPVLHGFPKPEHDKDRFNTWLYAIGSDILGLENERIYKYRRVCRSHFAEQYLCRNNKLSKIAIPTLNMPELFAEQKSMQKIQSNLQTSTSTAQAANQTQPDGASTSKATIPEGRAGPRAQKIKRQGTDPEEQTQQRLPKRHSQNLGTRNELRSWKLATDQNPDFAVVIEREDGAAVDEATAAEIRKRLTREIENAIKSGVRGRNLAFDASGLVAEGYFLVTATTEEAMSWLLNCGFGDREGIPLKVKKLEKYRMSVWLPGTTADLTVDPLDFIKVQNEYREELRVPEWTLICREVLPLGVRLVVGVPKEVAAEGGVALHYQATRVYARTIGISPAQTEKCVCYVCPKHDSNTQGKEPTESRPTNQPEANNGGQVEGSKTV